MSHAVQGSTTAQQQLMGGGLHHTCLTHLSLVATQSMNMKAFGYGTVLLVSANKDVFVKMHIDFEYIWIIHI